MNKRFVSQSLSLQLFCGVLVSLAAAAAVFMLLFFSGILILDKTVYGDAFMNRMADRKFERLEEYVEKKQITLSDLNKLNTWCRQGGHIYLSIYADHQLIYSFPITGDWEDAADEAADDAIEEDADGGYSLTFFDGTVTDAYLYYYTGNIYYFWFMAVSVASAFMMFSFCFITFVSRKIQYIQQLKRELDILAGGDLFHPVKIVGQDELGELAYGIDQMRLSILEHQAVEDEMRSSNSKLVTAMSHDLRTPLTSLLAYLELLDRGKYDNADQMKHFVKRSLGQAMRIKTMADQLFEYFLVYSTEWEQPEMETAEADALFQQIIGEYAFSLESQGYRVRTELSDLSGMINVNMEMIHRVFDNMYSNLLKYADKAEWIHMCASMREGQLVITVTNAVSPQRSERESTNLGLNTCNRIIRLHNGSFEKMEKNGHFQVCMTLPVLENKNRGE